MKTGNIHDLPRRAASRQEAVVQVRWVSRYFDQPSFVRALTNVNLEVYRGEVFGLLGPADCGKSTLIRILAGRLSPSEGRAKVFGRSPKARAMRARVGYLPQNSNDTRSHLLSDAADFLKEVFWLTRLGYRKSQPTPDARGKDRRGMLRQILIKNPELVLLDEPFSELDPAACDEVLEFIHVLKRHGRTVVLSDNALARAKDICDRLAVLRRGEIEAIGTLPDLLATRAGLHYVSELLPQATAERVLNAIRQDLGVPHHPGQTSIETQNANKMNAVPTPDGVLLPLVKKVGPDPAKPLSSVQSEPKVNHEMLAALTSNPTDDSRSRSEAGENTTAKPDP
jgi:ABC-2 type transport system ATP-binding protein